MPACAGADRLRARGGSPGPEPRWLQPRLRLAHVVAAGDYGRLRSCRAPQRSATRDYANRTVQRNIRRTADSSLMVNRNLKRAKIRPPHAEAGPGQAI